MVVLGAQEHGSVTAEEPLPGRTHYFVGNDPARWRTNIPTFARVRYYQVYPGVDLIYYGREGRLENDFELAPGADANRIAWRVEGADRVRLDSTGDLVLTVAGNDLRLHQPRAYQMDGQQRRDVPVRYRLHGNNVRFALGKYDRDQKLVIDPVLTYSTYLGGTGGDIAYSVALDSAGEAYVTGSTASINFPVTSGAYATTYVGDGDVFVTKFNASGTGVVFSTYLGGSSVDTPAQILLDSNDDIFLVGTTQSNNFPTTSAVFQPVYGGNQDAFLTEMKPDGSGLIYSTYISGATTGNTFGTAMTLDSSGNAYVTGSTNATDFPTMNPLQLANDGLYDAYVTEVSPTGALLYSTYLGGSQSDYGTGIAVDSSGDVYLSGYTYSANFPTQSALQGTFGGGTDVFVTKFKPGSSALLFSTFLGGSSIDRALAMYVDADGNVYLTGDTQSANFPVTSNAYQTTLMGTDNAFLAKIASGGSTLVFSTLLGGGGTDQATALALDTGGNIYLTGFTQSVNFPQLDSFQHVLGITGAGTCGSTNLVNLPPNYVCPDAFVAKFQPSGIPVYSSYLGGSGADSGQGIAVDGSGNAYVVGGTTSPNFPVTAQSLSSLSTFTPDTNGAYQPIFQGSSTFSNAFLTKIEPQDAPSISLTPQAINFGNEPLEATSTAVTVTLTNEGSAALPISGITTSGDFTQTNSCGTSVAAGGGACTIQVTFVPTTLGPQTEQLTISEPGPVTQGVTLTGTSVTTGGSLLFTPSKLTFPAQTVNTTGHSQSAVLVNNGNQVVTITNITAAGGFAQTNNCGTNFPTVPATLNVGQACTVIVSFTPTSTGSVTGSVEITSNAVSTTALSLSGTGLSEFSLSANARSITTIIGSSIASFTVSAAAPTTFTSPITLSCSSGATCTFSPSSIAAGQSSTLSVTGLSPTSANPLNFTVTGTSVQQTTTVSLSVFFADFSLASTPTGTTVTAGNNATYTITVTPTNGLSQSVGLSCGPIPQDTACYWNPPGVTFAGSSAPQISTLTITTIAEGSRLLRVRPPRHIPPGFGRWMIILALLALLGVLATGFGKSAPWVRPRLRLVALLVAISLAALGIGCENYVNPINITPNVSGTPAGTTTIVLTGTLPVSNGNGSVTDVRRATAVNLSVLPSS